MNVVFLQKENIGREDATDNTVMCCLQKPGLHKPGFFIVRHKEKEVKDGNNAGFTNTVGVIKAYRLYIQPGERKKQMKKYETGYSSTGISHSDGGTGK